MKIKCTKAITYTDKHENGAWREKIFTSNIKASIGLLSKQMLTDS